MQASVTALGIATMRHEFLGEDGDVLGVLVLGGKAHMVLVDADEQRDAVMTALGGGVVHRSGLTRKGQCLPRARST